MLSLILQKKLVDLNHCFVSATIALIQQRLPSHKTYNSHAKDLAAWLSETTEITIDIPDEGQQSFNSQVFEAFSIFDPHNLPTKLTW